MTNKEAKATLEVFQEDILNNLWLSNEQRKELAESLDLAIKALEFIEENYPNTFIDYLNGIKM